jgi:hypothetical protein
MKKTRGNVPKEKTDSIAGHFDTWSRDELVQYAEFLMRSYRVMDAFWFLNVEKEHGMKEACRFNEKVWAKTSTLAVRDIKKRFNITQTGLEGFVRVLAYYPWSIITGYEIDVRSDEVILTVPHCPPQEGRKRHGLGEYPCKKMHKDEFESIAAEVDPRIRVECSFAPPDDHPEHTYCRWRFTLSSQD